MKKMLTFILAVGLCFGAVSCNSGGSSVESKSDTISEEIVSNDSSLEEESDSYSSVDSSSEADSSIDSSEEDNEQFVKVTFKQDGQADVVKTLKQGETLTDVPTPAQKMGYLVEWDTADFTNITEDMTVTAVETAKTYTIILNANSGTLTQTEVTVTYGQAYALVVPMHDEDVFECWVYDEENIPLMGIWSMDTDSGEITLTAKWMKGGWTGNY